MTSCDIKSNSSCSKRHLKGEGEPESTFKVFIIQRREKAIQRQKSFIEEQRIMNLDEVRARLKTLRWNYRCFFFTVS